MRSRFSWCSSVLSASLLYFAEHDAQPNVFTSIAEHTYQRGLWRTQSPAANPVKIKFSKDSWAIIMKRFLSELDGSQLPTVPEALIAGIIGITPHRNATGHKLSKPKDVIRRDTQLRTRFEHGVDLLQELIAAAKPYRL